MVVVAGGRRSGGRKGILVDDLKRDLLVAVLAVLNGCHFPPESRGSAEDVVGEM